jgi:hypothetical protein
MYSFDGYYDVQTVDELFLDDARGVYRELLGLFCLSLN